MITNFDYRANTGGGSGTDGQDGADGLSAYQIWLGEGNTGTEQDFLDSLVGAKGVEVVGTRFASYQRGYDSGMSSGVNLITSVTSGDVFQIQCQRTDGAATTGYQDANGTRFNIKEM
jgi:hypothetical protein